MIILASSSPRRRELLSMIGLNFVIETSGEEEVQPHGLPPEKFVKTLALQKAAPVAKRHPNDCVIGADTIVYLEGDILGKPHTPETAKAYLTRMQGKSHIVYTGLAVLKNGNADVRHSETKVTFAPMSEREIDAYVATGEPLDKAGAYGVQGPGGVFVERVEGNYFNVIGLPLPTLYQMLIAAGELSV
ncbi:MAG: septum formation inhibitor Maf [Clostridiales bacterium]|nr:septum formation inhibitor Maf [Clostridiales bacterium]